MASQGSAWYVDFFRSDYLNVYGHMFTEERAEKESAFVARVLGLQPTASVLDWWSLLLHMRSAPLRPARLQDEADGCGEARQHAIGGDILSIPGPLR